MEKHIPHIEIASSPGHRFPPILAKESWFRTRRFQIFIIALLISTFVSLTYVFSRPAIYLSYATLLTVAQTAIDQRSNEADIQHVAIQKQILLGPELLAETAKRLQSLEEINSKLTVAEIRQILTVKPVEETNLIHMAAESSEPKILPLLINTWIDVYLHARAEEVAQSASSTTLSLQKELDSMLENINSKRTELEHFRLKNNITSTGREENKALARLKGLNQSLNKASEEEAKAKARLDAINKAISRGKAVVPKEDTRTLSGLENRAQQLREQLFELDQRYTRDYMALTPELKVVPEKLAELEAKIAKMRQGGQSIVLDDAQQEYAAAKQAAQIFRNQLRAHNKEATDFTARFSEHEAFLSDLEGLELLYRETQQRLAKIESKQAEKYPQVSVIERAFLPHDPIWPNYLRDSLVAIVGSILLSLSCVWLVNFLARKDDPNAAINLSGIHLYNHGLDPEALVQPMQQSISQQQSFGLESTTSKEISFQEFAILLDAANDKGKQLITLLLSGLSLQEISTLLMDAVDFDNDILSITGTSPRSIPLNPVLTTLFSENNYCLADVEGHPLTIEDLSAILLCSAIDGGLPAPNEINADAITHSYIIYLVRQGIRLSDLELIIGSISPTELSRYSHYSPSGQGRQFKEINLLHPALLNNFSESDI